MKTSPPAAAGTTAARDAWALFLAAHRVLVERIEGALAAAGQPPLAWYDVLWALERAEDQRLRMGDIAARVVLSNSNVTRLADRLAAAGLVRRVSDGDDRRTVWCVLTRQGAARRRAMWPVYARAIDAWWGAHLGAGEATAIAAGLARVLHAARDAPAG